MKLVEAKQAKWDRVRVLVQPLSDAGLPIGSKAGHGKAKQISLYETTIEEVYNICLKALKEE